ncbi:MAG: winged helix-turn-helix domain-containing protein [Candidatus Micrarchaeota archaeon]
MEGNVEDAVVMDQKTFKSLTSDTRVKILKLLRKRNYTLSEVAEQLGISKASAKEHLDVLIDGRLIAHVPSTNIWKYYTLTSDGKKLVGEEGPKRVVVLLATALIGFMLVMYSFFPFVSPMDAAPAVADSYDGEPKLMVAANATADFNTYTERTMNSPAPSSEQAAEDNSGAMALTAQKPDFIKLAVGAAGVLMIIVALFALLTNKRKESVI